MSSGNNNSPKICIIGAGFSGICAGIQLRKQLGIENFTIFDENHEVGGTWLVNTYPGCACDVPSHLYSFSFEPNPNWSKNYSPQPEIWEYLKNVARKNDLYSKVKFFHKVLSIEWNKKIEKWHVTVLNTKTDQETKLVFDIVVSGVGGLRVPNWPEQFNPFENKMHSAQWNDSFKLEGKNVAIVGSGASAVQIIPAIVDKCKRLIVYQRRAAWVTPRDHIHYSELLKWAFAYIPGVQWFMRNIIFFNQEFKHMSFRAGTFMNRLATRYAHKTLEKEIQDPKLREKLTPNYGFGCKRITPSSIYYPAMAKPNVTVITSKITEVTKDSIVNEDGTVEKPDVLILATGFRVQEYFAPLKVKTEGGEDLLSKWRKDGPNAYAGICTSDTPNLFFLLGPNTALGHNSVVFSIECQVNFVLQTVQEMMERNARKVKVKKEAEEEYMDDIMKRMESTVWAAHECGSWYTDHRGKVTVLWPDNLISYWNATKTVNFDHFNFA